MEACGNALRGLFIAPKGRKLVVSDLSNIEGRVLPWMAGEEWKLQAFRQFDAGLGPDMYRLAYGRPFGVDPASISSFQRQMGKGMELSLQYGGGVGAFLNISATYKLDLDAITVAAWDKIPGDVMKIARWMWGKAVEENKTFDLREDVYLACDSLKQMWRRAHPAIAAKNTGLWDLLEDGMRGAIESPAMIYERGRCMFARSGNWLRVLLPSGRELCYPGPRVDEHGTITYMGVNQYNHRWCRIKTYGGKIAENIDQAIARDVLAGAMPRAEAAGYSIVLTVHDELVTEAPDHPEFNAKHLSSILAAGEPWSKGLPLAAGGFEGYRYRKEG